jgi:hypothetical protein
LNSSNRCCATPLTQLTTSQCDGGRPACKGCSTRKIDCHYDHEPGEGRLTVLKRKFEALETHSAGAYELLENLRTAPYEHAAQLFGQIRSQDVPFTLQASRSLQGTTATMTSQNRGPPRPSSGIEAQPTPYPAGAPDGGDEATTVYPRPDDSTERSFCTWPMAVDPYAY